MANMYTFFSMEKRSVEESMFIFVTSSLLVSYPTPKMATMMRTKTASNLVIMVPSTSTAAARSSRATLRKAPVVRSGTLVHICIRTN